jgi:hypothetical protein
MIYILVLVDIHRGTLLSFLCKFNITTLGLEVYYMSRIDSCFAHLDVTLAFPRTKLLKLERNLSYPCPIAYVKELKDEVGNLFNFLIVG